MNTILFFFSVLATLASVRGISFQGQDVNWRDKIMAVPYKCAMKKDLLPDTATENCEAFPPKNQGNCFLECIFTELHLIQNGVFKKKEAKKLVKQLLGNYHEELENISNYIIDICAKKVHKKKGEKCSVGLQLFICIKSMEGLLRDLH